MPGDVAFFFGICLMVYNKRKLEQNENKVPKHGKSRTSIASAHMSLLDFAYKHLLPSLESSV